MPFIRFSRQTGLAILLAGASIGLSFPPYSFYILGWIGLVPLLMRWVELQAPHKAWFESASTYLVVYIIAGAWTLQHPYLETTLASLGGGLLLCFAHSLPFALGTAVRKRSNLWVGIAALVCTSLSVEYMLLHSPLSLPWLLLGHTQADALIFNQFVDLTGVLGLSAWVWLLNLALFLLLHKWPQPKAALPVLFVLLALPFLYGRYKQDFFPTNTGPTASVAVVQPAIPPHQWAEGPPQQRIKRLKTLSDSLLQHQPTPPDLLVWPETALPLLKKNRQQKRLYEQLKQWTKKRKVPLITGAITQAPAAPVGSPYALPPLNSVLLINGDKPIQQYDKRKLVPFAEQVPLTNHWPWLSVLGVEAGGVSGYTAGKRLGLLPLAQFQVAVQICFESVFGHLSRTEVYNNARFLIVPAQNGWWGPSAGPYQHWSFSRLRAIEMHRPVVMASASGLSGLIYPNGTAANAPLPWMKPAAVRLDVPTGFTRITPYMRYGDWVGVGALLGTGLLMILLLLKRYTPFLGSLTNSPDASQRMPV